MFSVKDGLHEGGNTMYQYKGYTISGGKDSYGWHVWAPDGTMYGPFATDKEAEEFIDRETE